MDVRMSAIEAKCAACPINVVDVRQHQRDITDLRVGFGRIEEKLDSILHWIHNGGNPADVQGRVRRLELRYSAMVGAGALASILVTTALALLATLR